MENEIKEAMITIKQELELSGLRPAPRNKLLFMKVSHVLLNGKEVIRYGVDITDKYYEIEEVK